MSWKWKFVSSKRSTKSFKTCIDISLRYHVVFCVYILKPFYSSCLDIHSNCLKTLSCYPLTKTTYLMAINRSSNPMQPAATRCMYNGVQMCFSSSEFLDTLLHYIVLFQNIAKKVKGTFSVTIEEFCILKSKLL